MHRLDYYAAREGWQLLILDELGRHGDPEARLLHGIRFVVAQYERALIARGARNVLAYKRSIGVRLGDRAAALRTSCSASSSCAPAVPAWWTSPRR